MSGKIVIFIAVFFLTLAGHGYSGGEAERGGQPNTPYGVVSSILPWGDLLKGLCNGRCEVEILIPPGATPHTWSPRPTAVKAFNSARFFVYTNDCLEPWVKEFLAAREKGREMSILRVGDLLVQGARGQGAKVQGAKVQGARHRDLHQEYHDGHGHCHDDPHLWLDFGFCQRVVGAMKDRLEDIDPEGAKFYEKNARSLIKRLIRLDEAYQASLAHCNYKTIVVAGHNAFKRLADRYGLKTLSVMGISPDAHVTPRGLTRVIEFLKKEGAKAVFFDHAVTDRIATVISSETGAGVLELSPGVALRKGEAVSLDFFAIMERNLRSLTKGLACNVSP